MPLSVLYSFCFLTDPLPSACLLHKGISPLVHRTSLFLLTQSGHISRTIFLQKLTWGSFTSTYSVLPHCPQNVLPTYSTLSLSIFLGPEATHALCSVVPWGGQVIQLCRPWCSGSALPPLCHSGSCLTHSAYARPTPLLRNFWAQGYPRMTAGGALWLTTMLRLSQTTPGVASYTTIWPFSVAMQKAKTCTAFTNSLRGEPVVLGLISMVFSQPNFLFNFSQHDCQPSVRNVHG